MLGRAKGVVLRVFPRELINARDTWGWFPAGTMATSLTPGELDFGLRVS